MIKNLIPDDPTHLEALLAPYTIHDHVPMNANEVLVVQDRVLVLPRSVDDLGSVVLIAIPYHFAEGVLDGGIVGVDEVAVDVLDCE